MINWDLKLTRGGHRFAWHVRPTLLMGLALGCLAAVGLLGAAAASAQTFSYTGAEQTYTAPAGATEIHVVAVGGSGGGSSSTTGRGAVVTADLPVTGGQELFVEVGGNGQAGGFNGGADGGGGASDVRTDSCGASCPGSTTSLMTRLIIAGGGGEGVLAGAILDVAPGGDAGEPGGPSGLGGGAGTQTQAGAGGSSAGNTDGCSTGATGSAGSLGQGGGGGLGGGGGYYGGGAGVAVGCGFRWLFGGGGGGSSYVEPTGQNVSYGLDSSATPEVKITVQPVASGAPSISGAAVQRQVLSEVHATWAGGVSSYAYQWLRCNSGGADCGPIAGATTQTYELSNADIGSTISVQETAMTPDGGSASATSAPTTVVAPLAPSPPPTISGAAVQGQVLTDVNGNWPGGPSTVAYQWQRCNTAGAGCVPIGGATNQTYALTAADVGSTISVIESVAYADGNTASATAAPTDVVQPVAPPTAGIVGPASALVGQAQTYQASITDSQGVPRAYTWSVQGRTVASGPTADISFSQTGTNDVLLQVTDTSGNELAATLAVGVSYPRLSVRVSWSASNSIPPSFSVFTSLIAHSVPIGTQVQLTCSGHCPFHRKTMTVAAAKSCHGKHCKSNDQRSGTRTVNLTSLVNGQRLPVGTILTIRLTKKSFIGEVETFTIGPSGPARRQQCLAPGTSKPGRGC